MKRVIVLLLCCLIPLSCAHADVSWRVFDSAGLFSEDEKSELESDISDFQHATNMDFVILTTDDYLGTDATIDIGMFFYDHGPFGFGKDASGMLYYIDMYNRVPAIVTTGETISLFSDDVLDTVLDAVHEYLVQGDYASAATAVLSRSQEIILSSQTEQTSH